MYQPSTFAQFSPVVDTSDDRKGRNVSTRLGIDIGGTKIAAGVVDHEGRLLATARRATAGLDNGGILAA